MTDAQIQANQALLRQRYRSDAAAAQVTLVAQGRTLGNLTCQLETGRSRPLAGMHPGVGGSGREACPGDMLLEALTACAGVTLRAVAAAMKVELFRAAVTAEGDLDFRGVLGLSPDVPIGFQGIRLLIEVETSASDDQLAALRARTEALCVVSNALQTKPTFTLQRVNRVQ